MNYLLENSKSKDETIYLLNYYLEQFRTTVHRQTMFAEFEKIVHQRVESGEPLTADEFTNIYYKLNEKYYGKSAIVDKQIGIEWARIPHFYSNFYVYKYATGSEYPLEQLKSAGVDMTKKESIEEALNVFAELVNKLEKEL